MSEHDWRRYWRLPQLKLRVQRDTALGCHRCHSSSSLLSRWKGLLCQQPPVQRATMPMSALILESRGVISGHSYDSFFWMLTHVNIPFIFLVGCLFTLSHAILKVKPVPPWSSWRGLAVLCGHNDSWLVYIIFLLRRRRNEIMRLDFDFCFPSFV